MNLCVYFRSAIGPARRNADHGGPQDTVVQEIAPLKLVHDMLLRNLLGRNGRDGLMRCGIEGFADRFNGRDIKSRQGCRQLIEREFHALHEHFVASAVS